MTLSKKLKLSNFLKVGIFHKYLFKKIAFRSQKWTFLCLFWIFRPISYLKVSCTVPNVGAAGGPQNHNGLCVLSQNVINEKMYLAIWFWTVFLIMFIVPFFIVYRLTTILFACMRSALLMGKCQRSKVVIECLYKQFHDKTHSCNSS